jgi:hypothetical protein
MECNQATRRFFFLSWIFSLNNIWFLKLLIFCVCPWLAAIFFVLPSWYDQLLE